MLHVLLLSTCKNICGSIDLHLRATHIWIYIFRVFFVIFVINTYMYNRCKENDFFYLHSFKFEVIMQLTGYLEKRTRIKIKTEIDYMWPKFVLLQLIGNTTNFFSFWLFSFGHAVCFCS